MRLLCEILETNKNIEGLCLCGPFDFDGFIDDDADDVSVFRRLTNALSRSNIQTLIFDEGIDFMLCNIFNINRILKENHHLSLFEFPVLSLPNVRVENGIPEEGRYFSEEEWKTLCNGIRFHPRLSDLKISFYQNDDPHQTQLLFHSIANNENIKSFSFNDNQSGSVEILDELIPSIALMSTHLKTLQLQNVIINNIEGWGNMLSENTNLTSLSLTIEQTDEHDEAECKQFNQIVDAFKRNGSILSGRVTNGFYGAANLFERNQQNLEKTISACQTILAIKQYRKSPVLQTLGRDISLMLAKFLKRTRADYESWGFESQQHDVCFSLTSSLNKKLKI